MAQSTVQVMDQEDVDDKQENVLDNDENDDAKDEQKTDSEDNSKNGSESEQTGDSEDERKDKSNDSSENGSEDECDFDCEQKYDTETNNKNVSEGEQTDDSETEQKCKSNDSGESSSEDEGDFNFHYEPEFDSDDNGDDGSDAYQKNEIKKKEKCDSDGSNKNGSENKQKCDFDDKQNDDFEDEQKIHSKESHENVSDQEPKNVSEDKHEIHIKECHENGSENEQKGDSVDKQKCDAANEQKNESENGHKIDTENKISNVNDSGFIDQQCVTDEIVAYLDSADTQDEFWIENYMYNEVIVEDIELNFEDDKKSIPSNTTAIMQRSDLYCDEELSDTAPEKYFDWTDILCKTGRRVKMMKTIDIETSLMEEWVHLYSSYQNKLNVCTELYEKMPRHDCGTFRMVLSGFVKNYRDKKIEFHFNLKSWISVQMILITIRAICFGDLKVSKKFRSTEIYYALGIIFRASADFHDAFIEYKENFENGSVKCVTAYYELNKFEAYNDLIPSKFSPFEFNEMSSFNNN